MRVLTDGSRRAPLAAAIALGSGLVLLTIGLAWAAPGRMDRHGPGRVALDLERPPGGDPRSSGQGPGLVGEPIVAIGIVLGIAAIAVVATTVVRPADGRPTRLTGRSLAEGEARR